MKKTLQFVAVIAVVTAPVFSCDHNDLVIKQAASQMTKLGFTGKGTDLSDNDLNWDNDLFGRCFFIPSP